MYDFYLYFRSEHVARKAAEELLLGAYTCNVRLGADDSSWLVLAKSKGELSEADVDESEGTMNAVASKYEGEYDGYERDA